MTYYVEYFDFGIIKACITKETAGFRSWIGGCAISDSFKDIHIARKIIFDHVIGELLSRKEERRKEIERIQKVLDKLENDVFNLSQFKTVNKG